MAFIDDPENNRTDESTAEKPLLAQGDNTALTGSADGVATQGAGSGASATPKGTASGSWTNLQSYLDANKDQGAALAQNTASSVNGEVSKAQGDLGQVQSNFNTAVNQNTVNYDPSLANQVYSDATKLAPDQTASFQRQLSAQYGGPSQIENDSGYQSAYGEGQKAATDASLASSQSGRATLLNTLYGTPTYNQGQKNLDDLLLEGNAGNGAIFDQARGNANNLQNQFQSTAQASDQLAKQAQATTDATRQQAQSGLLNAATGMDSQISQAQAKAAAQQQQDLAQYKSELDSGVISAQDAAALGLSGVDTSSFYGQNPFSNYLTPAVEASKQTIASQQQVAQLKALAALGGQYVPGVAAVAQQYDPSAAGTYGPSASFDVNRFKSDQQAGQAAYNNALNAATDFAPTVGSSNYSVAQLKNDLATMPEGDQSWRNTVQSYIDAFNKKWDPLDQHLYQASQDAPRTVTPVGLGVPNHKPF